MAPSITSPEEHRSFAAREGEPAGETAKGLPGTDGRMVGTPVPASGNPDHPTRYGDLRQNLMTHWRVQER
ncbi:hypothetical protein BH10PSE2_BH10PSE2_17490 [soil metagenome]